MQLEWVYGNHLGVPLVATDAAGSPAVTPGDYLAPGFLGQSRVIADLYYNRYRDYDPATGRYIQADPIGLAGGSNPYAYVGGNPVNWVDPMGLAQCVYLIESHVLACVSNNGGAPVVLGPKGMKSGAGGCENNPACVDGELGPIEPGRYRMNRDDRPEHAGRKFRRLERFPHRSAFWYHLGLDRGGFELHLGTISYGCINADKYDADLTEEFNEMDRILVRDEGENWLTVKLR